MLELMILTELVTTFTMLLERTGELLEVSELCMVWAILLLWILSTVLITVVMVLLSLELGRIVNSVEKVRGMAPAGMMVIPPLA